MNMAYLNFTELQGSPVAAPADIAAAPRTQTGLSALEWQVVAIAQNDRLSSLEKPGKLATAMTMVFGGQRPNPALADSRLEALRRLAVHAWHKGYTVPRAAIRAFHEAGFTSEQYETLLASISRGRAALNQGIRA
jgi:alkylhydroperoxidase family enzyme